MVEEKDQDKQEHKEKVMPFLEHLEELRMRLLKAIIAVFGATIGCYFFSQMIMTILTRPYYKATSSLGYETKKLIFLAPAESFIVSIKISLFAGIFISLPILFYQLWKFAVPGLLEKEKKFVPLIAIFSTLFFLIGEAFCYFVIIPYGLKFLLGWQPGSLEASITIKEYLKFVTMLVLVFGLVFELPLLSFFLTKMGLLTHHFMRKNRRYGIVLTFILAAILTPPDIVTQLLLAGPLILLYEISIIVSKFVSKEKVEHDSDSS